MGRLLDHKASSEKRVRLYDLAAILWEPTEKTTPDKWGADNRVYPPTSGKPGQRDPLLTPYIVPYARGFDDNRYSRNVFVTGAQSGKTETILDVIGYRCDTRPVPILYVGPSREFLTDQFEPRLMGLFDEAPKLKRKLARGKRMKKTLKRVAGVTVAKSALHITSCTFCLLSLHHMHEFPCYVDLGKRRFVRRCQKGTE